MSSNSRLTPSRQVFTLKDILMGVVVPAAIAAFIAIVARLTTPKRPAWAAPVAIGAGFFVGAWVLLRPTFPPHDAIHWLCFAAPMLAIAGPAVRSLGWWSRAVVVAGIATLTIWLVARPLFGSSWENSPRTGIIWIAAITLASTAWWALTDAQAARAPGLAFSFGLATCLALASATIAMSGSQTLGQLVGILTAAVGAIAILGLLIPGLALSGGGMLVVSVLFSALLACALEAFYAHLLPAHAALLFVSPLAGQIADIPPFRSMKPSKRGAVRFVAMVTLAIIGTALAGHAFSHAMARSGELGWE